MDLIIYSRDCNESIPGKYLMQGNIWEYDFSMMKWIFGLIVSAFVLGVGQVIAAGGYVIESFDTQITINQDTSITVTERIEVNFDEARHGIFRDIPVRYSNRTRLINADFDLISVTNAEDRPVRYEVSNYNQSKRIKIGDPDVWVTNKQVYVITYRMDDVLLVYDGQPELYWNVTGSEWDTEILSATANVNSSFAGIRRTTCYSGRVGSTTESCIQQVVDNEAIFVSERRVFPGNDFTLVVGLDSENQLVFPTLKDRILENFYDNVGYLFALGPLLVMGILWYRKGRDQQFLSGNVYYTPETKDVKLVNPWERKTLPMVYAPIDGLTPAQLGVLMDERVDLQDVVAEIMELVRLGYLELYPVETEGFFFGLGGRTDYVLLETDKTRENLKEYQIYLLSKLFNAQALKVAARVRLDDKKNTGLNLEHMENHRYVFVSSLKNNFYTYLNALKKKLYENLVDEGYFPSAPDKVRSGWSFFALIIGAVCFFAIVIVAVGNFVLGQFVVLIVSTITAIFFAQKMPRRTPKGYALYRQILGLRYFVGKGKWRYEIQERNLFVEEILPLAIAMGVLSKLTKEMDALEVTPPEYVHQSNPALFGNTINSFSRELSTGLSTAPSSSGGSSWSGGSGFSGGSSGGGFGGGGGGSW